MSFTKIKKAWKWIWQSDSILSWVVALAVIYIIVKFIFFPGLSLILGSSLPLAGVESSSMEHQIVKDNYGVLSLCNNVYNSQNKKSLNFSEYWENCGDWYEQRNISKQTFSTFPLKNGFSKGDVIIVWGRFKPKLGEIIIFKPNPDSTAPRPIIHRIVNINENGIIQTKGDHNKKQLTKDNNIYKTDETNIKQEQIIGKAVIRIPFLGYPKIWAIEIINAFR